MKFWYWLWHDFIVSQKVTEEMVAADERI